MAHGMGKMVILGGILLRQVLSVFPKESSLVYRGVIGTRSLATLAAGFHQGVPPAVLKASPTDDLRLGYFWIR